MGEKILAVAAGHEITESEFAEFVNRIPEQQRAYVNTEEGRKQALIQYANYFLFEQLGKDRKYDQDEEFCKVLEGTTRELLGQYTLTQEVKDIEPTIDECREFYEKNSKQFQKGAQASAKHILVDSEDLATEILGRIQKGEIGFEDAARQYSSCPSKEKGGDLGTFTRGQMVPEFDQAVFGAKAGDLLGPVKTQFGFHLIQVDSVSEGKAATFEESTSQIYQQLLNEKQNAKYMQLRAEMIEKYGLTFTE